MLDISKEAPLSLAEAATKLPRLGGKKIHCSTLWRWCRKGLRGTKLEYVRLGDRIVTTEQALVRFANLLADKDALVDSRAVGTRPTAKRARQRAIEQAERRLDRAGV